MKFSTHRRPPSIFLVGDFNPSEKYGRQIGSSPLRDENNIFEEGSVVLLMEEIRPSWDVKKRSI